MSPLFGGKKEQQNEPNVDKTIAEILNTEKIKKQDDYREGSIYLTDNFLLWKKKRKVDSTVVPLKSIIKVEQATKLGLGGCIKVIFGQDNQEIFLPFNSDTMVSTPQLNDLKNWLSLIESSSKEEPMTSLFTNIAYAGGHKGYPKKKLGRITITPLIMSFQETEGLRQDSLGEFKFDIPIEKIKEISIKSTSEVSKIMSVLAGPLWGMGLPAKHSFILVEYEDSYGITQTPLFDFPTGDMDDKRKRELISVVYEQMKNMGQKQDKKTDENPLNILKIRYVKGEITKEEYEKMKETLEAL